MHFTRVFLFAASLFQGSFALDVVVTPRQQVVREGDPIQMLCKLPEPLEFCRIQFPPGKSFILKPEKKYPDLAYFGEGMDKGHCGVIITSAKEANNGNFSCSLTTVDGTQEITGKMRLTVAKRPSRPELSITKPANPDGIYEEGETLLAFCIVKNGRPAANITWYIGDERITDGLSTILLEQYQPPDLHTVSQNLTRRIQASDNGKDLKCVAGHTLLNDNTNTSARTILVKFPPKGNSEPLEKFGLVEGEEGKISVTVMANPKPEFMWIVGEEKIYEGEQDSSGRFRVLRGSPSENKSAGSWDSVLVIDQLMKEDVDRNYQLLARNALGEQMYTVMISTNLEPKMFQLGAPIIAGIVVAVLVILTAIALVVFARAKGRWCFSGNSSQFAAESSDTESADHHASHPKVRKTPFTSVFKKKTTKDLVEETTQQEAPEDEREEDSKDEAGQVMLDPKNPDEGVVYAELDLNAVATARVQVRPDEEKTEYAEIIHTKGK